MRKRKKVFLSLGFSDRPEEEVLARIDEMTKTVLNYNPDAEIVHNYFCKAPENHEKLYYLGEAIKKLSDCDICLFDYDYESYNGCRIEYFVCYYYGIPHMYMQAPNHN